MNYILSKDADKDMEDIYRYGKVYFGKGQARAYIQNLKDKIQIICDNPNIGRIDKRTHPAIHRFECKSHVIFYDVTSDGILIARILHGAADFVQHF